MDTHALSHIRQLLAILTAGHNEDTSLGCDERANSLMSLLTLLTHPPGGKLQGTAMQQLVHHLALVLRENSADYRHVVFEVLNVQHQCPREECGGDGAASLIAAPRLVTRKLADRTRFTQTVLRLVGDLAWLWLQCRAHASVDTPEARAQRRPPGQLALFREPPEQVQSDLLFAATTVIASFRLPIETARTALIDVMPADAAAEFFTEILQAVPELQALDNLLHSEETRHAPANS